MNLQLIRIVSILLKWLISYHFCWQGECIVLYCIASYPKEAYLAQTKVARTIYIKEEQLEALKKLSEKTKVPQSVYVREALDMLLEKYSEQLRFDFVDYFKR